MDNEYWLKRWQEGRTGWHHEAVMPLLEKHWPTLDVAPDTRVLVPFCGKTLDMFWLAQQGLRVLGVEVSPLAIGQFFSDNNLHASQHESADGIHHVAGDIEIIEGDLFGLGAATLGECSAIYDRAALIAQSPLERRRYAERIYARLPVGCRGLMITLEYPQSDMHGPPFSVEEPEVRRLLAGWDVEVAERRDILANQPGFREGGVTALDTVVYHLRHTGSA
jgi:thiopurine S-methyltransferase